MTTDRTLRQTARAEAVAAMLGAMHDSVLLASNRHLQRRLMEAEAKLRYSRLEYCNCGAPLTQCGELNQDGEPTLACNLCMVREQRDTALGWAAKAAAERDSLKAWKSQAEANHERLVAALDEANEARDAYRKQRDALSAELQRRIREDKP